jgi:ferredoxin
MSHLITDHCDGCSACVRQCPTQAIVGTFKVRFHIEPTLCIDCNVCGTVCARGAVRDQEGAPVVHVARADRLRPVVDANLCNGCELCSDICPVQCRGLSGKRFFGVSYLRHTLRCTSCGECANICIKGAITMEKIDLRRYSPEQEKHRLDVQLADEEP